MKSRLLKIEYCTSCHHFTHSSIVDYKPYCSAKAEYIKRNDGIIPDWCPLPEASNAETKLDSMKKPKNHVREGTKKVCVWRQVGSSALWEISCDNKNFLGFPYPAPELRKNCDYCGRPIKVVK